MKRPMLYMFVYYAGGIVLGRYLADAMYLLIFAVSIFLTLSIALYIKWKNKAPFIFFIFFLLAFCLTNRQLAGPDPKLFEIAKISGEVYIEKAEVIEAALPEEGKQQLVTVKCSKISYSGESYGEGSYEGSLKLSIIMPKEQRAELWDIVSFKGELLPLEKATVPGTYNEWLYLKTKGFDFKMFPEMAEIHSNEPIFFISSLWKLKSDLHDVYDLVFPPAESGLVKAITTGDKKSLDDYTKDLYRRVGISHILAISGLNVSALAVVIFFLLEALKIFSKRQSALIVICFLIVFAMFTGFSASTVRAVVMVSVVMLGTYLFRFGDYLNNIAISALLILLIQPLYLFDIGFQLSFITISGMLFCSQILKSYPNMPKWQKGVYMSIAATLASYPISAYYFHWISLVSIVANILIIPMTTLLLAASFITGLLGLLYLPAAVFAGGVVYAILKAIEYISVTLMNIPGSFVCIGSPSVLTICLWYASVLAIYCWNYKKYFKIAALALPIAFCASLLGNRLLFHENKLAFLDVGQGDSAVLTTFDKRAYVFDTGGSFWANPGQNTGERIVRPYLEREGITKIDGLFLSHMDSDHALGALELLDGMEIKGLYISDYDFEPTFLYADILTRAKAKEIPVYLVQEGQKAALSEGIEVSCLYPKTSGGILFGDDNNGSMVLKLAIGEVSVLLTGDASTLDEGLIQKDGNSIQSTILKVGHHGSKYSSSTPFLQAVKPELAVISCGEGNSYGHPNVETIERLNLEHIKTLRTDQRGTISIVTDGKDYRVETMLEEDVNEGAKKTN